MRRTLKLALLLAACDPQGPGAIGTISLPAGVSVPSAIDRVRVLALPDGPGTATGHVDGGTPDQTTLFLADAGFPLPYAVGGGIGTSPQADWRVVAWLAGPDAGEAPASGDRFGTATFKVNKCAVDRNSFCGITSGVNLTLDQLAP